MPGLCPGGVGKLEGMFARSALCVALLLASSIGPARAASGDSDAFGYTVRSSTDGGSPYAYTSVTSGTFLLLGDEDARTVQLPFVFPFYGSTYSSVDIHSNGALTFGAVGYLPWDHTCGGLPTITPRIWAWYDDLDPTDIELVTPVPGVYRSIVGAAPERVFVVEWFQLPLFEVADTLSFQVKLFEADGRVELHFADTQTADGSRNGGATAAVGITNANAAPLLFSCDDPTLSAGFALTFYPPCDDVDGDGYCPGPAPDPEDRDCDDTDPDVHPGAEERCNGLDDDCDGAVPDDEDDGDGDGERGCEGDCDDGDPDRHTGADEVCNGVDDDCDEQLPQDEADGDEDGVASCDGDCDDENDAVHPGADEECNDVDDDCDGGVDDVPECDPTLPPDPDGVPYGCLLRCSAEAPAAPSGAAWAIAFAALFARRRRRFRADRAP